MTTVDCPENQKLHVLQQLFASATHDASAVMCQWTNSLITLTLDEVCEIPMEDVCRKLNFGDELLTMVVLTLDGEIGGVMILTFDDDSGRRLVASLLGEKPNTSPEWTEMDKSALTETGNILGCAYMNAMTRLINCELIPSPPYFIQDYGASVMQQALLTQHVNADNVLICRTVFCHEGEELSWRMLFVPTAGLRQALEAAIHSDC